MEQLATLASADIGFLVQKLGRRTFMRFLSIICVVGAALTFPIAANAAKAKSGGGKDLGAIREQCRAQATSKGGVGKQAEVKACVQRATGKQ
jgi:hypothetical protein